MLVFSYFLEFSPDRANVKPIHVFIVFFLECFVNFLSISQFIPKHCSHPVHIAFVIFPHFSLPCSQKTTDLKKKKRQLITLPNCNNYAKTVGPEAN